MEAAGAGRVLELGARTGRLAIPLIARGVDVDGIRQARLWWPSCVPDSGAPGRYRAGGSGRLRPGTP